MPTNVVQIQYTALDRGFGSTTRGVISGLTGVQQSAEQTQGSLRDLAGAYNALIVVKHATRMISGAIGPSIQLEGAMMKLRVATRMSAEQVEKLSVAAREAALATAFTPVEAIEGSQKLALVLRSVDATAQALKPTLLFAQTYLGKNIPKATQIVTKGIGGFGKTVGDVPQYLGAFAAGAVALGAPLDNLNMGLGKLAAGAATVGASFEDVYPAYLLAVKGGLSASEAATGLKTGMLRLSDPKVRAALEEQLGIVVEQGGAFVGMQELMAQLAGAQQRFSTNQVAFSSALREAFGQRAVQAWLLSIAQLNRGVVDLEGNLLKGRKALEYVNSEMELGASVFKEAGKLAVQPLDAQFAIMKDSLTAMLASIFPELLSFLQQITTAVQGLANSITFLFTQMGPISTILQWLVGGGGRLLLIFGALKAGGMVLGSISRMLAAALKFAGMEAAATTLASDGLWGAFKRLGRSAGSDLRKVGAGMAEVARAPRIWQVMEAQARKAGGVYGPVIASATAGARQLSFGFKDQLTLGLKGTGAEVSAAVTEATAKSGEQLNLLGTTAATASKGVQSSLKDVGKSAQQMTLPLMASGKAATVMAKGTSLFSGVAKAARGPLAALAWGFKALWRSILGPIGLILLLVEILPRLYSYVKEQFEDYTSKVANVIRSTTGIVLDHYKKMAAIQARNTQELGASTSELSRTVFQMAALQKEKLPLSPQAVFDQLAKKVPAVAAALGKISPLGAKRLSFAYEKIQELQGRVAKGETLRKTEVQDYLRYLVVIQRAMKFAHPTQTKFLKGIQGLVENWHLATQEQKGFVQTMTWLGMVNQDVRKGLEDRSLTEKAVLAKNLAGMEQREEKLLATASKVLGEEQARRAMEEKGAAGLHELVTWEVAKRGEEYAWAVHQNVDAMRIAFSKEAYETAAAVLPTFSRQMKDYAAMAETVASAQGSLNRTQSWLESLQAVGETMPDWILQPFSEAALSLPGGPQAETPDVPKGPQEYLKDIAAGIGNIDDYLKKQKWEIPKNFSITLEGTEGEPGKRGHAMPGK